MNSQGRYETDGGHYYTSGSSIEFLKVEEIYNSDTGQYEDTPVWTVSRVEHDGTDYYIVTYGNVELSGLKVRVRGGGGKRQGEQYKAVVSPFFALSERMEVVLYGRET